MPGIPKGNVWFFLYLTQVSATDVDTGLAGQVTYSVVQGNEEGVFQLDPQDGWLSIVEGTLLYNPNVPKHTLLVQASDGKDHWIDFIVN